MKIEINYYSRNIHRVARHPLFFWSNRNFYVEGRTAGEAMKNFSELRKELTTILTICDNWCGV